MIQYQTDIQLWLKAGFTTLDDKSEIILKFEKNFTSDFNFTFQFGKKKTFSYSKQFGKCQMK